MTEKKSFMRSLRNLVSKADLHKGKVVGGFSLVLFALPTSAMLFLPKAFTFMGFNSTAALLTGVTTSVLLVLGLTFAYAWVAYKSEDTSEAAAKYIVQKATKGD